MANILLINGPNLNMLGNREPEVYGKQTLPEIVQQVTKLAQTLGHQLNHFQSNAEHELIECIHKGMKQHIEFIIINPAGFTHTSVELRDALLAVQIPFIEVHLSNIFTREPFRAYSYFSDIAKGVITGFGAQGYELALHAANNYLNN